MIESCSFRKKAKKLEKTSENQDEIIEKKEEKEEEKEEISEIKERNIFQREIIDLNEDDEEKENEDELNKIPKFSLEIWAKSECVIDNDHKDWESLEEGLDEERLTLGIIIRNDLLSRKKRREKSLEGKEKDNDCLFIKK